MPKPSPFEEQFVLKMTDEQKKQIMEEWGKEPAKVYAMEELPVIEFNEPKHYHQNQMDTIEFLQKGFPPEVCMGFFLGNVVKYAQRANYKNGLEDFDKMVDYALRAREWYKRRFVE